MFIFGELGFMMSVGVGKKCLLDVISMRCM